LAEASLAQVLASKVDESLNERTVFDDAQKITELYKKSGLANAEVKYSCNVNEDVGIGEVTFEIAE
jgi:outer membrane protein assembly factor BamA